MKRKPASHTKGEVLAVAHLGEAGGLLASGNTNAFSACLVYSLAPLCCEGTVSCNVLSKHWPELAHEGRSSEGSDMPQLVQPAVPT